MKNLLLILLIAVSFGATAKSVSEKERVNVFENLQYSQVANTTSVFKEIKGELNKSGPSCVQSCIAAFQSCTATAQGWQQWIVCEINFERCMSNCGI